MSNKDLYKKYKKLKGYAVGGVAEKDPSINDPKQDQLQQGSPEDFTQQPNTPSETEAQFAQFQADHPELADLAMGGMGGIKNVGPAAEKLAMDLASRMARAKEMGFNTNQTMYHGTGADIKAFKPAPSFDNGTLASSGTFLSPNPEFASTFANSGMGVGDGSVYPVITKVKNTFDYENPEHVEKVMDYIKNKSNPNDLSKSYKDLEKSIKGGDWVNIETPVVQKAIKKSGFDSYHTSEEGQKNLAVYNPADIRSINAKFDPSKTKSKNILAGTAGTVGTGAALNQNDDTQHYAEGPGFDPDAFLKGIK